MVQRPTGGGSTRQRELVYVDSPTHHEHPQNMHSTLLYFDTELYIQCVHNALLNLLCMIIIDT